jgi:hypothetical protein
VSSPSFRIARLAPGFDLGAFDCGEPVYNQWLTEHAANAVKAGSSAVYLLLQRDRPSTEERMVGYYAICPTLVVRDQMPKQLHGGVLRAAPAWLLAKLALGTSLRGDQEHQWGRQLLRDALETIVAAAELGGGQIVVVDADNAGLVKWYARQGFRSTGGDDLRMYMKISTARKYLNDRT